jgi:hypothetical protein
MIKDLERFAMALREAVLNEKSVELPLSENVETFSVPVRYEYLTRPSTETLIYALDAASATLHTGFGEVSVVAGALVSPGNVYSYPNMSSPPSSEPPFIGALYGENLGFVNNRYIELGHPYRLDPFLPEGAIAHDLRINLENYLMEKISEFEEEGIVLIDGPATYPFHHVESGSKWSMELGLLNEKRVRAMKKIASKGFIPVCVVKRVWSSTYLPHAEELGLKDVEYILRFQKEIVPDRPLIIGPWEFRERVGVPDRMMAYVLIPLNVYGPTFTVLRIEMLRDIAESIEVKFNELASMISYNALMYAAIEPIQLLKADRISKELVKRIASLLEAVLRKEGLIILYGGAQIE